MQLSPDGQWWWDGSQWRRVQAPPDPQPYGAQPAPGSQPQQQPYGERPQQQSHGDQSGYGGQQQPYAAPPYGGQPGYGEQQQQQPRGSRRPRGPLLAALAVLAAAAIAVPVAIQLTGDDNTPTRGAKQTGAPSGSGAASGSGAPSSSGPTMTPGQPVTEQTLDKVSPADFYWQLLQRQMTQPVAMLTHAYFRHPKDFKEHSHYYPNQLGIDRKSGKFSYGSDQISDSKPESMNRCVNGKEYYWSSYDHKWDRLRADDDECQQISTLAENAADDGIVANGMTEDQAGKVIAALRDEYKGFANPSKPTLLRAKGQTFIKQVVEFKPRKLEDGRYWGNQLFTFAFKESGLDPKEWHWYQGLGPGEGLHVVYYLSTSSLLPVAAIQRSTPVLDNNGKPSEHYDQTVVYNYKFPKALPREKVGGGRLQLLLPEGWAIK